MTENSRGVRTDERAVFLVEEQSNPSTDCYVLPVLAASGYRVTRCGFTDVPSRQELGGASVLFVRYVPTGWAKRVAETRRQLHDLVFFMDDDVLDVRASADMSWHYRLKLARLAAGRIQWLRRQEAALWVSTPYLQQKYADWAPRLVLPVPTSAASDMRRVFYHGTASHDAEKRWLRPIVEEILHKDERLVFEIVGGQAIDRLYRGLSRVNVVHQMKWPAYQAFLSMPGRHVGLAPLLRSPFNRARSYTKFFDITRCGAAGIYSNYGACADIVSHGTDGLVVGPRQDAWASAILHLIRDEPYRETLVRNAHARLATLASEARSGYAGTTES